MHFVWKWTYFYIYVSTLDRPDFNFYWNLCMFTKMHVSIEYKSTGDLSSTKKSKGWRIKHKDVETPQPSNHALQWVSLCASVGIGHKHRYLHFDLNRRTDDIKMRGATA